MQDGVPFAQRLNVASAGSTVFGARLVAEYIAEEHGLEVCVETDHGHLILEAALAGTLDADVILLPDDMINRLIEEGAATNHGCVAIGLVSISAATGDTKYLPNVSSRQALIAALTGANEIVLTKAPTGAHMLDVIAQLNLTAALADKIRCFDKSQDVNAYLASLAEPKARVIAFGPATEIIAWKNNGVYTAGPIASEFQLPLSYSAAQISNRPNAVAVQAFLAELASDHSRAAFKETGVE